MQQFLHYNVGQQNDYSPVKNHLAAGKPVFIFVYMDGCGPCNKTVPEWDKVHTDKVHRASVPNEAMMVRVNRELKDELAQSLQKHALSNITTFPTIGTMTQEEEELEPFEGEERSAPHFVHWVTETTRKHRLKRGKRRVKKGKYTSKFGKRPQTTRKQTTRLQRASRKREPFASRPPLKERSRRRRD